MIWLREVYVFQVDHVVKSRSLWLAQTPVTWIAAGRRRPENAFAVRDGFPVSAGRTLVIPRRHVTIRDAGFTGYPRTTKPGRDSHDLRLHQRRDNQPLELSGICDSH